MFIIELIFWKFHSIFKYLNNSISQNILERNIWIYYIILLLKEISTMFLMKYINTFFCYNSILTHPDRIQRFFL